MYSPYSSETNVKRDPELEYSIIGFKDFFTSCFSSKTDDKDDSAVAYTKLAGDGNTDDTSGS